MIQGGGGNVRVGYLQYAVLKGLLGQAAGPLHGLAVVIGPPAGAVDVHVVRVETDRAGLDGVRHDPVQHADPWVGETDTHLVSPTCFPTNFISTEHNEYNVKIGVVQKRNKLYLAFIAHLLLEGVL